MVAQRNYKTAEEVEEIERAVETSVAMHTAAIQMAQPGMLEMEISAVAEHWDISRMAVGLLGRRVSFCSPGSG